MRTHILFISASANRTGAPLSLLRIMQWIKTHHPEIQMELILRQNGPLNQAFQEICTVYRWEKSNHRVVRFFRTREILMPWQVFLVWHLRRKKYACIFANSVGSVVVLEKLLHDKAPTILLRVEELNHTITQSRLEHTVFSRIKHQIDRFIAVSALVGTNLTLNHGIPAHKISIIHESPGFEPDTAATKPGAVLRQQLGISEQAFIIGGSGGITWRKGVDLFIQVARILKSYEDSTRPIHFVWVGGNFQEVYSQQISYDVINAELASFVHFVGETEDPRGYMASFNLFLLTSREDPFPLVALESGLLGNPVLCFDRGVGSAEFIDDTCGAVVPYLDTTAMAQAARAFYQQPLKLAEAGKTIQERCAVYKIDHQAPKVIAEILAVVNQGKS